MLDTTLMVATACDGDKPSYARHLMTIEDAVEEYEEFEKAAGQGD